MLFFIFSLLCLPTKLLADHFYPSTERILYEGRITQGEFGALPYSNGNTSDGKGQLLYVTEKQRGDERTRKSELGYSKFEWIVLEFRYHDGVFTKSIRGNSYQPSMFNGKSYITQVVYERDVAKNSKYLEPVKKVNFKHGLDADGIYCFDGTADSDRSEYRPLNAICYGKNIFNYEGGSYKSSFKDGKQELTTITYAEGLIAKQTGIENPETRSFIFGSTEYRNGDRYDGFFTNSERFGPGILYGSNNLIKTSGFWKGDKLLLSTKLFLPLPFVATLTNDQNFQQVASPTVFLKTPGRIFGKDKNNRLFAADDRSLYYYGDTDNDKIDGLAYLQKTYKENVKNPNYPNLQGMVRPQVIIQSLTFGRFLQNRLTEGAKQTITIKLPHTYATAKFDRSTLTEVGKFDKDDKLFGCGLIQTINWNPGAGIDFQTVAEFEKGLPIGLYKTTVSTKETISEINHSKNQTLAPDALYEYLQTVTPSTCSGVTQADLDKYIADIKVRSDRWIATADTRKVTDARIAADRARDSLNKAKNYELCYKANSLIGYRAMKGKTEYIVLTVNCGFKEITMIDPLKQPVGVSTRPIAEIADCIAFGEKGTAKYCGGCNGFGDVYKNKRNGVVEKMVVVQEYAYGKPSRTYNKGYSPNEWNRFACTNCGGKGYLWATNR